MFKELIKEKYLSTIFFALILFTVLYIYNDNITTSYNNSKDTQMRMAIIETLGVPALPIISQCCTSRNLVDGIYARRSELPGGYCFHADCDVAVTPNVIAEKVYKLTVIKKDK